MPKQTTRTTTVTKIERDYRIEELLYMLLGAGDLSKYRDISLYMWVPGGGDWSNTKLEVQGDQCLTLSFDIVSETEEEYTDD